MVCKTKIVGYKGLLLPNKVKAILFIFLVSWGVNAQEKPLVYPFRVGEVVKYNAYYNWQFVWLNAGTAEFYINDTLVNGVPAYHFKSLGASLNSYDWFFKVRERFESIAKKESLAPLWFIRESYEGGYKVFNRYSFSYSNSKLVIDSYTSNRPYKQNTFTIDKPIFDVLTAIYYCRTIDFKRLNKGDLVPLTMAVDDGVYNLYIRYLGPENIKHRNGNSYDTYKFSVKLVEGTIFKGGEDMIVWVSRDEKKIPIVVEAKILIGSVMAYLLEYKVN